MTYDEAMAALKAAGTEQTRKTYARHGADATNLFGVSYADLYKLIKKVGTDQALAERLWASGNHDARVLATHVADPAVIAAKTLDQWIKQTCNHTHADAVAALTVRTPHADEKARAWTATRSAEFIAAAGWSVVAGLAMAGTPDGSAARVKKQPAPSVAEQLDEAALAGYLTRIEREIATAKNRVKHSMNNALICIALRGGTLRANALSAARRIGPVEVDHGDTSCKTPDAVEYVRKIESRRKSAGGGATKRQAAPKHSAPASRGKRARPRVHAG